MGSVESGIRDMLNLVGKQRDELATLLAENERLRDALHYYADHTDEWTQIHR